ncbi:hypothetical protein [Pseudopedobacter beijingensis]|uniref:Uncharacterized protein n=1 Tax=Pseudopedobacter beijingensis TaxID=1207056 RepID=A0ABW4ICA5_9SPHI
MMKTSTIDNYELLNGDFKCDEMKALTEYEKEFYADITPALNSLVKSPSEEAISRILDYSKSL